MNNKTKPIALTDEELDKVTGGYRKVGFDPHDPYYNGSCSSIVGAGCGLQKSQRTMDDCKMCVYNV